MGMGRCGGEEREGKEYKGGERRHVVEAEGGFGGVKREGGHKGKRKGKGPGNNSHKQGPIYR